MPIQKVHFMSRANAEKMPGHQQVAVIAIGDPSSEPSLLADTFGAVHRLEFNDVDTNEQNLYVLFDKSLANDIWEFVDTLPSEVDTLVVHCHLGVSRSAAVAKSIAQYLQVDYPEHYSLYNKLVYTVMQQALYKRIYPESDFDYS